MRSSTLSYSSSISLSVCFWFQFFFSEKRKIFGSYTLFFYVSLSPTPLRSKIGFRSTHTTRMSWHHRCNWGRPSSSYDSLMNRQKNMQIHRWHVENAKSDLFQNKKRASPKLEPLRSPPSKPMTQIKIIEENSRLLKRLQNPRQGNSKRSQGLAKGSAFYTDTKTGKQKRITQSHVKRDFWHNEKGVPASMREVPNIM